MSGHEHQLAEEEAAATFEPPSWEERYLGEVSGLTRAPRSTSAAEKVAT